MDQRTLPDTIELSRENGLYDDIHIKPLFS
jgi:hypothetical protein